VTDRSADAWIARTESYLALQRELAGPELYGLDRSLTALGLVRPEPSPSGAGLDAVRTEIGECRKCGLAGTRTNFVFGTGNPGARLMLVGEAPGEEEDRRGEPFVGEAGRLLDRILASVGFER
jgi:uracil-DNA glycosylase